jgi:hypothetical protein
LSDALAVSVIVPLTVVLLAGVVTLAVGAVVSGTVFCTFTVIVVELPTLPAASRAVARIVCVPFATVAEFQFELYGAVESFEKAVEEPSRKYETLVTPTLSLADAEIVTVPDTVALFVGAVIDTWGGVVSALLV